MEVTLNPQFAERDRVADGMYRDELHMCERDGKPSSSTAEQGEPMRREVSYEALDGMSLESLLYYVLVGEGRRMKEDAQT
jgi:hypothetical protein